MTVLNSNKSNHSSLFLVLFSVVLLFVSGCMATNQTTATNSNVYIQAINEKIKPEYIIYHSGKETSSLFYKFESDRILYARTDKSNPFKAKVAIHYRVYNEGTNNPKNLIDSSTHFLEDVAQVKSKKSIFGEIPIKLEYGKNYRIYIQFKDVYKNAISETFINVNKTSPSERNFFMLLDAETNKPYFENYHTKDVKMQLVSKLNAGKTLYANYYQRDFPIAPPPFASINNTPFQYKPDVALQYVFDEDGKHTFDMHNKGFVHFLVDSTQKSGFTFYRYNSNFPLIRDAFGMAEPLKFICTKLEYENLMNSENPKLALDEFWLNRAGTKERAREIIKMYYNRVQDANDMFTSYIEGWKTDRGMISLIFGLPKTVRKDFTQEVWIYGEESNAMSLQFIFSKVSNPFSVDDFKLQRSLNYKSKWYSAVDAWRSGRVYWAQ